MSEIRLTRPLQLEEAQRVPDGAGGFDTSWVVLGTLWADVQLRSGREAEGETVNLSSTRYRIFVRAAPDGAPSRPIAGQRFRNGERVFKINAVAETDGTARFLVCYCDEEVVK
ncbi:MAG: head-tail adaptor protein [Pseudomonadota bacterium]|mgnify:CR=1 FL=1